MKHRKRRAPIVHIVSCCIESTEQDTGQVVFRWAVATAGVMHVGDVGASAAAVLQQFENITGRDDGLRKNDRLEHVAEPVTEREFVNVLARLRRKQFKG